MRRVLVGKRGGRSAINWPAVLLAGGVVGAAAGASAAGTWYLLTGEFDVAALLFPLFLSFGWFAGAALRDVRSIPLEKLPHLD
jgi:hypothetical protein